MANRSAARLPPHIFRPSPSSKDEPVNEQVEAEDINSQELWIGGEVTKRFNFDNSHVFRGIKATAKDIKKVIVRDLNLQIETDEK